MCSYAYSAFEPFPFFGYSDACTLKSYLGFRTISGNVDRHQTSTILRPSTRITDSYSQTFLGGQVRTIERVGGRNTAEQNSGRTLLPGYKLVFVRDGQKTDHF